MSRYSPTEPSEDGRPLLRDASVDPSPAPCTPEGPPPAKAKRCILALLSLMLVVNLSASLYQLPLNRVIERRLCAEYYAQKGPDSVPVDRPIDEQLCKVDGVQQSLARIQGVMETAWVFGDFIMTIPLGYLAERYGRRKILLLNLIPRVCMLTWVVVVGHFDQLLPTKAVAVSPFLSVLGGDCVFNSLVYALASELTADHVVRASYFGYMSSVSYVVALLGPALASASMSILIYLPFWIGTLLLAIGALVIPKLPNLQSDHIWNPSQPHVSSPVLKASLGYSSLWSLTRERIQSFYIILSDYPKNFMLLLASFLLTSLASSDTKLLVQYISKRYSWTFASAGYLLSGKAVVNFTLLAVIIPRFLQRRSTRDADRFNLLYSRICLLVSVLGAGAIAFSATIWLLVPSLLTYALGSALPVFTMSLLKSPCMAPASSTDGETASPHDNIIFSIVMLVKTLGSLIGAPLMAFLWVRGIALGDMALGMPYFVSSACYIAAIAVFYGIRVYR